MLTPVVRRNRTVFTRCNWFSGHVDAWCYWPTSRLISIQPQHTNTFTCQTLAHLHTHKHIHYSHICWCVDGWLLSSQQASLVVLKRGSWGILITLYSQTAEADVVLARCINTPPHRDDGKRASSLEKVAKWTRCTKIAVFRYRRLILKHSGAVSSFHPRIQQI